MELNLATFINGMLKVLVKSTISIHFFQKLFIYDLLKSVLNKVFKYTMTFPEVSSEFLQGNTPLGTFEYYSFPIN